MAHFGKDLDDFKRFRCVHLQSAVQTDNFTVYVITVTVGPYTWTVNHRYSEFHDLHEKLTAAFKLDKTLLPPKKVFGNQTESFVKKRQRDLEIYLQTIILYMAQRVPSILAYFLDFDKYEIHGITQAMAEDLYNRGESLLQSRDTYEVSTLQLYSLTERLKLPEPTCDSGDVKKDLGHILDFITRAKNLKVVSSKKPVGTSNIVMNRLTFDLTLFKSLRALEICGCNFKLVNGLETVKQTVCKLEVHESTSSMKEILLQDSTHWKGEDGSLLVGYWDQVEEVDFSRNSFVEIHESIQLMPNVARLDLSENLVESVQNLQWLSQLTHLNLSYNNIRHLDSLHTKLGNVKAVNMSHNQLDSLHGFVKLFSLQSLDVSYNRISTVEEVRYVSHLPCLEHLQLEGNAVTSTLDYRTKSLEMFGDRVKEVILDGQVSDQKELDTVAVLQALKKAKDVKVVKKIKKNMSAASLSEVYSRSPPGSLSEQTGERASPLSSYGAGAVSQSVPAHIPEWTRKDNDQTSESSYAGMLEEGVTVVEQIPEAHPYEIIVPSSCAAGQTADINNSNACTSNRTEVGINYRMTNQQAHSYDQTISIATSRISPSLVQQKDKPLSRRGSGNLSASLLAKPQALSSSLPLTSSPSTADVTIPTPISQNTSVADHSSGTHPQDDDMPPASQVAPEGPDRPEEKLSGRVTAPVMGVASSLKSRSPLPAFKTADLTLSTKTLSIPELPRASDQGFMMWLTEQLTLESGEAVCGTKDSVLDVLWCYAEQCSLPGALFPCCVILSPTTLFIEKLGLTASSFSGVPQLEPCSILLISNIQQITIGPCHAFVRIEEAFVGKSGVYTLFSIEPQSIEQFVQKIFQICHRLDLENSPDCVDLSVQSDLLKIIASKEEQEFGISSDRLAVAILVRLIGHEGFSFLVLSENRVYCLDLDFTRWPPASFETNPASQISVHIIHQFSIMDKISDIKILPIGHAESNVSRMSQWKTLRDNYGVNFEQFPLGLDVPLTNGGIDTHNSSQESHKGCNTSADYSFSSLASRDLFLDRLTNLRAEQAHRMSPSLREEPEGGNEQFSITDGKASQSLSPPVSSAVSKVPGCAEPIAIVSENSEDDSGNHSASMAKNLLCDEDKTDTQPDQKPFTSGSLASNQSLGTVSLTESDFYDTETPGETQENLCFSTSPQDDRAVSPTSEFSRASVSPIAEQVSTEKSVQSQQQRMPPKADSLPSSYEWKKYYFKSPPNTCTDTCQEATMQRKDSIEETPTHHVAISLLEEIESSSEWDPVQQVESEHDVYLKQCVKSYSLIQPLPTKLKPLGLMNGKELRKFFHSTIAAKHSPDSSEGLAEELHYVLWASVVPYTNPRQEITTLVMLSTAAIYFVSDAGVQLTQGFRPSWMSHARNRSDSAISWKTGTLTNGSTSHSLVKPYFILRFKDLHYVNIGLFSQCVRLTGQNENSVFTIVTRDRVNTEVFIQKLKQVLSLSVSSPLLERSGSELEQDFYRDSTQRTKSTVDGHVYMHPSQVSFVYPGDDAIQDILYLVKERIGQTKAPSASHVSPSLWLYMLCYLLPSDDGITSGRTLPRSIIITPIHFCLAEEDVVTYPLPDFVRGLPEHPCHEIVESRRIETLKRVVLYHAHPNLMCLTFADEMEDIVVDVSMQHFAQPKGEKQRQQVSPEISLKLYIQSVSQRDKLVEVLEKLWKQQVAQVGRILDVSKV